MPKFIFLLERLVLLGIGRKSKNILNAQSYIPFKKKNSYLDLMQIFFFIRDSL